MTEARRRNPVLTGWMVAVVGLIIAFLLGWALMSIGASRLAQAEKTREPLRNAVAYIATQAAKMGAQAADAVAVSNWGEAQRRLADANSVVTALESARSDENRRQIDRVREALGKAQTSVGQQSAKARDDIARLIGELEELKVE